MINIYNVLSKYTEYNVTDQIAPRATRVLTDWPIIEITTLPGYLDSPFSIATARYVVQGAGDWGGLVET